MCLSALFSSKMILTCTAKLGFIFLSRSDTSLCTVLLLIPNFLAAPLTVSFESIIYCASSIARSSIAVSYTHLDVYKRQVFTNFAISSKQNLLFPLPDFPYRCV